ncbi:MAG: ANTAR domain-containing protein [Actinobacteria bacterium]|nr:MAG: ANTAR domain-containing protein [Actinomycetota bacterium]
MSSAVDSRANGGTRRPPGRPLTASGESFLRIGVPPGTPDEARAAIERLLELSSILARRAAQLQEALDSRIVIEQAKGVLCERYSIDADQAFQILRRGARSNRMRIHDLAASVIASRTTPPELSVVGLPGLVKQ